jgi:short-subunit dehydrogenase
MKTILITGASSGIGKTTALYFADKGWQVFATMRNTTDFNSPSSNLIALEMDVTNIDSIQNCLQHILKQTNKIDAIVNNAGFGAFGAFELSTSKQRQEMYDVNVFGLMNVTQHILPHFRENNSGIIVNISSIGGLMTYPLFSVYHSTKCFTESIYYELKKVGIRVKLVEPGATQSDFAKRSLVIFKNPAINVYNFYQEKLFQKANSAFTDALQPTKIAETIFTAISDNKNRLRYPIGNKKSMLILRLRNLLPTSYFMKLISKSFEK